MLSLRVASVVLMFLCVDQSMATVAAAAGAAGAPPRPGTGRRFQAPQYKTVTERHPFITFLRLVGGIQRHLDEKKHVQEELDAALAKQKAREQKKLPVVPTAALQTLSTSGSETGTDGCIDLAQPGGLSGSSDQCPCDQMAERLKLEDWFLPYLRPPSSLCKDGRKMCPGPVNDEDDSTYWSSMGKIRLMDSNGIVQPTTMGTPQIKMGSRSANPFVKVLDVLEDFAGGQRLKDAAGALKTIVQRDCGVQADATADHYADLRQKYLLGASYDPAHQDGNAPVKLSCKFTVKGSDTIARNNGWRGSGFLSVQWADREEGDGKVVEYGLQFPPVLECGSQNDEDGASATVDSTPCGCNKPNYQIVTNKQGLKACKPCPDNGEEKFASSADMFPSSTAARACMRLCGDAGVKRDEYKCGYPAPLSNGTQVEKYVFNQKLVHTIACGCLQDQEIVRVQRVHPVGAGTQWIPCEQQTFVMRHVCSPCLPGFKRDSDFNVYTGDVSGRKSVSYCKLDTTIINLQTTRGPLSQMGILLLFLLFTFFAILGVSYYTRALN